MRLERYTRLNTFIHQKYLHIDTLGINWCKRQFGKMSFECTWNFGIRKKAYSNECDLQNHGMKNPILKKYIVTARYPKNLK